MSAPVQTVWRVRVREVRRLWGGLRWTIDASTPDLEAVVYADSTAGGSVYDLQSDEYSGTTGDEALDDVVRQCVRDALATRNACQLLDGIDRRRWGRIQLPADRRWAA